jgi:hypothetical protein
MNHIMTQDSQQAITHVLQQDSKVLETLLFKLKQLKQLQQIVAEYLEPKLSTHCQVANLTSNCLIIITDSAIWATQFRFQIPSLLPKLQQHPQFYYLKNILCKIRLATTEQGGREPVQPVIERLSSETAQIILDAAKLIKHSPLKNIMQKIAKNTSKPSI